MKKPKDSETQKWIDEKDRLPDVGLDVLAITIKGKQVLAHVSNSGSWYDYDAPVEYVIKYWAEQI